MESKRILLVCANPRGTDALRLAQEERTLKESLKLSPHRSHLDVTVLNAATIDDLRRQLLAAQYDLVHFSGHGTRAGLVFEDTEGRLMVPDSASLGALLERRGVSAALLNACYSLSAGSFSSLGVEYTVAMEGPIADDAAIEFTRGFYDALGAGLAIPDAYEEGLSCVALKSMQLSAVLLRKGQTTSVTETPLTGRKVDDSAAGRRADRQTETHHLLLGVALDTSGSMESSIRNEQRGNLSRLSSARDSLSRLARNITRELRAGASDPRKALCRIFVYAFGLRYGDVADLVSLAKVADSVDIRREVDARRQRLESEARDRYSGLSDLGSLARGYGFGGLVDDIERSVRAGAERAGRERIASEMSSLLLDRANALGDSTVTPSDLADLLDRPTNGDVLEDVEPLIYGATPMLAAVSRVRDRFERTPSPTSATEDRVFLIVSDGDPTDGDPRSGFASLRASGVTIVACYVTDGDIANPRLLLASPAKHWPAGAHLMFDAASVIDDKGPFAKHLLRRGWCIEPGARLFVQVNHSDVLEEFIEMAASPLSVEGHAALPRGR